MGGIYAGVFTPTEAAAWGAFAAIILLLLRVKKLFLREATKAGWEAAVTTAIIFFVILAAIIFTRFLTLSGFIYDVTQFITTGGFSPFAILWLFIFIWVILGMFMSGMAVLLLVAPLAHTTLVPLGFDGIWLGIIMVKMMELGAITPPFGVNVYAAKALVPEVPTEVVFRGILPFAIMDLITVAILAIFPQ